MTIFRTLAKTLPVVGFLVLIGNLSQAQSISDLTGFKKTECYAVYEDDKFKLSDAKGFCVGIFEGGKRTIFLYDDKNNVIDSIPPVSEGKVGIALSKSWIGAVTSGRKKYTSEGEMLREIYWDGENEPNGSTNFVNDTGSIKKTFSKVKSLLE